VELVPLEDLGPWHKCRPEKELDEMEDLRKWSRLTVMRFLSELVMLELKSHLMSGKRMWPTSSIYVARNNERKHFNIILLIRLAVPSSIYLNCDSKGGIKYI
jgi:hypothetical protein